MHVLSHTPEHTIVLMEAILLQNTAPNSLVEKSLHQKLEDIFMVSGVSDTIVDLKVYECSYLFGSMDNDSYFSDVFLKNYALNFTPEEVLSWLEGAFQEISGSEYGVESLTQYPGAMRMYSETHPTKDFAECEQYHCDNLNLIYPRFLQAKKSLEEMSQRVKAYADGGEGSDVYIQYLLTELNSLVVNDEQKLAVTPGQKWKHSNGIEYKVLHIANAGNINPSYPVTVVYQTLGADKIWTRELGDWHRSMTLTVDE